MVSGKLKGNEWVTSNIVRARVGPIPIFYRPTNTVRINLLGCYRYPYKAEGNQSGPSRGGKGGKDFPGPATFGGPRRRSKILKMVFQVASF